MSVARCVGRRMKRPNGESQRLAEMWRMLRDNMSDTGTRRANKAGKVSA